MRRLWMLPLLLSLGNGCIWVSKGTYDELWDKDGDQWPFGTDAESDCNDDNADMYPYAPDYRGDGCDADCGMEPDDDGDDWPNDADCAPDDASIFPCSTMDVGAPTVDVDCDGKPGISRPEGDCDYAAADPDWDPNESIFISPEACQVTQ